MDVLTKQLPTNPRYTFGAVQLFGGISKLSFFLLILKFYLGMTLTYDFIPFLNSLHKLTEVGQLKWNGEFLSKYSGCVDFRPPVLETDALQTYSDCCRFQCLAGLSRWRSVLPHRQQIFNQNEVASPPLSL